MQPTAAPWARRSPSSTDPLPAVSRGETTKAPWHAVTGPALTGQRVDAVIKAEPRLPPQQASDYTQHEFSPARKIISSTEQLKQFLKSEAAKDFLAYILALNEAVKGRQLSDPCHVSAAGVLDRAPLEPVGQAYVGPMLLFDGMWRNPVLLPAWLQVSAAVGSLKGVLDTLWQWVDEIPPASHTLRYGNPAYR
jgi:serine/threonine-protein phosphatase 2A activator